VTLVIDVSVAAKWVLSEPESERANALLGLDTLIAPGLWLTETANVLWKYWRRGLLRADEVRERIDTLQSLPVQSVHDDGLAGIATGLAISLDQTVYDCLYLAVAVTRSAVLVTADRRFLDAVEKSSVKAFIRAL
jgi:predicted nucleic acid-binding protein